MLKFLFILSCLLAAVFGKSESHTESSESSKKTTTTKSAVAKNNYYRYTFDSSFYFAYAVNNCSATDFSGSSYIYPYCVSSTVIEVGFYSDSSCTTLSSSAQRYNSSSSGQSFRCNGTNAYAELMFGISACETTFYIAPEVCIQYHPSSTKIYSSFYCHGNGVSASISAFNGTSCTATEMYSHVINDTCNEVLFDYSSFPLYGELVSCAGSSVTTTASSGEVSSESSSESTSSESSTGETGGPSTTTTSSSSSGNMIALNIFGLFIIVAFAIIF